jgi:hypothetical protein
MLISITDGKVPYAKHQRTKTLYHYLFLLAQTDGRTIERKLILDPIAVGALGTHESQYYMAGCEHDRRDSSVFRTDEFEYERQQGNHLIFLTQEICFEIFSDFTPSMRRLRCYSFDLLCMRRTASLGADRPRHAKSS